jgi:DNA-directed RNA polymerase specialized sigma subunit
VSTMNPSKMTAPVVALYDLMMDGEWHENAALISFAAPICAAHERDDALRNGRRVRRTALAKGKTISDEDLIASGAKDLVRNRLMIAVRGGRMERDGDRHRMTEKSRTDWLAARGPLTIEPTASTQPAETVAAPVVETVETIVAANMADASTPDVAVAYESANIFGGIPEGEGWARAPRMKKDRVHFRLKFDSLPVAAFRAAMPADADITYDEESGLCRMDVANGTGQQAYALVAQWCAENGYETKGLRVQADVWRRNLADLDPHYLSDLCAFYQRYSRGQVRKHASTLKVHFNEQDDQTQQVFEWILEAIALYDETSGVPFGAFLVQKMSGWVHDLNRTRYGRHITEQEMRQQRAATKFSAENGREATEAEMAEMLGQDLTTYREKSGAVANLRAVRNCSPLTTGEDDEMDVPLAAEERVEDRHEANMRQALIAQVITKACGVDEGARGKLSKTPNILAWVTTYETTWNGQSKVALASNLSTSTRNMSQYTERAQERMREIAGDLLPR